jgi:hypothetical protein
VGSVEEMSVVVPGEDGVVPATVRAALVPVRAALDVLTRARGVDGAHPAAACWGAAAMLALQFTARGLLLPV